MRVRAHAANVTKPDSAQPDAEHKSPDSQQEHRAAGARTQVLFKQGLAHHQSGRLAQAEDAYHRILRRQPRHVGALHLLGVILGQRHKHREALSLIDRALGIDPANADAHNNRGRILNDLGQPREALASFGKAISLKPSLAEAHCNRGQVLMRLRRLDEALDGFEQAIELRPEFAEAHNSRGSALFQLGRDDDALSAFDRALSLKSEFAEAHYNRGIVLAKRGRLDEALASFDRAVAARPDYAEAYFNRANVLKDLQRTDAALASFDRAIALKPDYAEAFYNRGNVLLDLKRPEAALASFDHAIKLQPRHVTRHQNLALCRLLVGDFARGWEDYERRWWQGASAVYLRSFRKPLWLGRESLAGKTILLHGEQGLGEMLQFCRYAALVRDLGARVILEVPDALSRLIRGLKGVDHLVSKGASLPAFDYHCPLMSLPLAFKTSLETIPATERYIQADPEKVRAWHHRLGPATGPRIGLAWHGNPNHAADDRRSIPLALLRGALAPDLSWFSLHREVRETDAPLLAASKDICHFGAEMNFEQTAALIETLDLVISVDTSIAHLAGAMGKPTWILLPFTPDWRWLMDRDDSPWYPSVRLIRQSTLNDWAPVMQKVFLDLQAWRKAEPA